MGFQRVCHEHLLKPLLLQPKYGDSSRNYFLQSADQVQLESVDLIITDPPYYDAIPYSDSMDFFYVWLRRSTHGLFAEAESVFSNALGPKWDHDTSDGELIDDASRFGGDKELSKQNYEDGMARAFRSCHTALQTRRTTHNRVRQQKSRCLGNTRCCLDPGWLCR